MIELTFADGEEMGAYDGERTITFKSAFIDKYKNNAQDIARAKAWKTTGSGAVFREAYSDPSALTFESSVTGVYPAGEGDEVVYSFRINQTSGIYKRHISDEKTPETHVINSVDLSFGGGSFNAVKGELAVSVGRGYYNSDIALFDVATGDYKTITEGDTADEDPFISDEDPDIIYYASRAVGRDSHGDFAEFAPSAIYRLNLATMQLDEVASSNKYGYFKPVVHNGELYAIRMPAGKKRGNPLLEIVLIPYRILQGIAGFINMFVNVFAGKSLTSSGSNPAKGRDYDSRKIAIAGNLVDVEKEARKNSSKKDSDYGFVPKSYELVKVESGEVLASGVADFDIATDGTIYYTNGRRIFALKDGVKRKVCNTSLCLRVSCRHSHNKSADLFNF